MSDTNHVLASVLRALAQELAKQLAPALAEHLKSSAPTHAQPAERTGEEYLSVKEACERFQISRATFDRTLRDPSSGLGEVIVRFPPATGRAKVPLRAFEAWLRARPQRRRARRGGSA